MTIERPSFTAPRSLLIAAVVILTYVLSHFGWRMQTDWLPDFLRNDFVRSGYFKYFFWWGVLPVVVTWVLFGKRGSAAELGLEGGFFRGLGIALFCTLPMLLGYAWIAGGAFSIDLPTLVYGCLEAGFFEEVMFRAFLFGFLYRKAGWGLLPATLIDGLVFGAIHLSQGETMLEAASVFGVTAAGGIGFSIVYKEFNWNLWVPVFLHFFMNFFWMGFDVADNAAGGVWANVFRGVTILLTILVTASEVKRRKAGREVSPRQSAGLDFALT